MKKNKIKVSDSFIEAYQLFNVNSQVDKIHQLSRKERLLLFTLAIDSYSEDSTVAIENFRPYKEDLDLIYSLQNDDNVTDEDLIYLSYIDTSSIIDQNGNKLPSPTTEEEAKIKRRDLGISQIFDGE